MRVLLNAGVSAIVCYLIFVIGLSFLGAIAFASPGANWSAGIGPMPLFGVHSDARSTTFSLSWGVAVVAVVLGAINAGMRAVLAARRDRRQSRGTA